MHKAESSEQYTRCGFRLLPMILYYVPSKRFLLREEVATARACLLFRRFRGGGQGVRGGSKGFGRGVVLGACLAVPKTKGSGKGLRLGWQFYRRGKGSGGGPSASVPGG